MDQAVIAFDVQRMLFGDQSPAFLLEIGFRTLVIYAYTLLMLRWLGSRTVGQLSTVEFLLVIALGSAVGDAMFYPDVPLLHAMLVVTIVVIANKGLDKLIARSKRAEEIIDGQPREVIRDGALTKSFLGHRTISRDELFQQLREDGIEQLGEVWRAYIEKDGDLTVFRHRGDIPSGLRIVPPSQIEPYEIIDPGRAGALTRRLVCADCGTGHQDDTCSNCEASRWTESTVDRTA